MAAASLRMCSTTHQVINDGDDCAIQVITQAHVSQSKGAHCLNLKGPYSSWTPYGGLITGVWNGGRIEVSQTLHNTMTVRHTLKHLSLGVTKESKMHLPANFDLEHATPGMLLKAWDQVQDALFSGRVINHAGLSVAVAMCSGVAYDHLVMQGSQGQDLWKLSEQLYLAARDEYTDCLVTGLSEHEAIIVATRLLSKGIVELGLSSGRSCTFEAEAIRDLIDPVLKNPTNEFPPDLLERGAAMIRNRCFERGLERVGVTATPALLLTAESTEAGLKFYQVCAYAQQERAASKLAADSRDSLNRFDIAVASPNAVHSLMAAIDLQGAPNIIETLSATAKGIRMSLSMDAPADQVKHMLAQAKANGDVLHWKAV